MFAKGPDVDKKKLLAKASDVKRDSLTRLKHFKTLIEHLDFNETHSLFRSHFSFIYHTFIDTFSTFDCNSKQRRADLECILFIFEKIIIYNPELIKKRWQFYSITFVMQKLLHQNNTWQLRQEGVRLFVLWFQILCDDQNAELQQMFGSLVPGVVPKSSLPISSPTMSPSQVQQQQQQLQQSQSQSANTPQLPIKLCSIEPLVPKTPNEQMPNNEPSFYLDNLLQCMVTQTTKPFWSSPEEAKKYQELGFSFIFNMFKEIYLQHLFPDFNLNPTSPSSSGRPITSPMSPQSFQHQNHLHPNHSSAGQYVDDPKGGPTQHLTIGRDPHPPLRGRREPLHLDLRQQQQHYQLSSSGSPTTPRPGLPDSSDRSMSLSGLQAIVIKWLTRILRQDLIPGQDELIRTAGNSADRRDLSAGPDNSSTMVGGTNNQNESEYGTYADPNSTAIFQGIETSSREMVIARRVIGTWPENIAVVHELFRRAFLTFYQPASMKRVVNVYKEWICNGGPNQAATVQGKSTKIGYTSFNDLLQIFVRNSSNAFLTRVHNANMLDEQFEMCKRIMNIYRFMVMKIYMNTPTWEQLLNVMLMITEQLFPVVPPERKESTIGGRIAPAFFQTFIVSWIRANLYVHISTQMWYRFHGTMRDLIKWRELVEEWSTTMGSLTRVLVKHVYGLSLTDLPLDKPQERRRRPKALKSFSTAEAAAPMSPSVPSSPSGSTSNAQNQSSSSSASKQRGPGGVQRPPRSGSVRLPSLNHARDPARGLTRSNSDGIMFHNAKLYYSSLASTSGDRHMSTPDKMRKIKSEYLILTSDLSTPTGGDPSDSVMMAHNDAIDGGSLKDSMILDSHDQTLDSHHSGKSSMDSSSLLTSGHKSSSTGKRSEPSRLNADKCVLLGGSVRGWTSENSIIMWRRMLGLFGNINQIEDPENHLVAMKCLEVVLNDFTRTRENLGISLDNQSTPEQPKLVPPYTFCLGWLLEATLLPRQYKESRLLAYKLLCAMSIRRHDIELPHQYYIAFYEALHRGLSSPDPHVHASIIQNSVRLLSYELPGSSSLVQGLYERARAVLLETSEMATLSPPTRQVPTSEQRSSTVKANTRDESVQILSSILSLNRPIKKLMVLRPEPGGGNSMNLVAPGDIKAKVFETLLACNTRQLILDSQTRCKSLSSLAIHVYQELSGKSDAGSLEVEKLFDTLMTELQDATNPIAFRMNCDLLRLFSDHATSLSCSRPALVSSLIQILSQLIVRLSTDEKHKDAIQNLLICLEDWCMAVGKGYLVKPVEQFSAQDEDDTISIGLNDSLITIVLRSLESVIYDEQFVDDASNRTTRGSMGTSKASDTQSSGRQSQGKMSNTSSGGSHRDRTLTNSEPQNQQQQQQNSSGSGSSRLQAVPLGGGTSFNHLPARSNKNLEAIKMACKVSRLKLVTYLGHFPFRQVGSASMSCVVNELDYLASNKVGAAGDEQLEQPIDLKDVPGLLLLVIDGSTIISFIGAPRNSNGLAQPVHLIVRNLCGKYSWDASCLEADAVRKSSANSHAGGNEKGAGPVDASQEALHEAASRSSMMTKYDSDFNEDGNSTSSLSSRSSSSRDCIGDLLNHLSCSLASANGSSISSSSCQNMQRSKRNSAQSVSNPKFRVAQAEETMIALLTNQRFQELNYCERSDDTERTVMNFNQLNLGSKQQTQLSTSGFLTSFGDSAAGDCLQSGKHAITFEQCRQLIQQLSYLSWEKRCKIDSLTKSARLARELKNLDSQPGRETHKIAVIYVAQGQEDKNSILTNSSGSRAFEDFVSGLGWDVDLSNHLGFKGGLQSNKSTGETSTYYCNATTEVMFHVSTRIPVSRPADDESLNRKLRHLGNDEIHIVWSEHVRDYRRGIIPTEFGDIIIAIYPMLTFQGYYRVQITSKADVPPFGPLFDNCIVHQTSLSALVRATAINASRAKRLTLPYYQPHFEERGRLIESIVQNHREKLSFEEFALQLYTHSVESKCQPAATSGGLTANNQDRCCT